LTTTELRKHYPELADQQLAPVDIVDDGEQLATIDDASQDFVIACHFLEHCVDPVGAIGNMLRVLKSKGILFLIVPDKRRTFDADRRATTLEHLLDDHKAGRAGDDRHHFIECRELEERVDQLMRIGYSIHRHVWTQAEVFELISALKIKCGLSFDVELFAASGNEMIFVIRKDGA